MNPSAIEAVNRDNDLAAAARRDQDHDHDTPIPGPNLRDGATHAPGTPAEGAAVGGGAVAGAAAGAVAGTVVGGPVGAVVGGAVGGVVGALGGAAVAPDERDEPSKTIPGPQEREVTRVGEVHQEDLRR